MLGVAPSQTGTRALLQRACVGVAWRARLGEEAQQQCADLFRVLLGSFLSGLSQVVRWGRQEF